MNLVYIASPLAGDTAANVRRAIEYCRIASAKGVVPLAPHTIFTRFLNDAIPDERRLGMRMGIALLERCDELWVFGAKISTGMKSEITVAHKHGIPVRYFDPTGEEVAL